MALVLTLLWPGNASAVVEIYNTETNFNWTCPPGITNVMVEVWGGGGAGGGSFVSSGGSTNAGGGGGGGGAYAALTNVPVTPGNSYTITIPAAATCPTSGFSSGNRFNGSNVTFTGDSAITVTANGGEGGQCRNVTTATPGSGAFGAGGAVSGLYDIEWAGGTSVTWSGGNGGGGGGGAGDLGGGGGAAASNGSLGVGGIGSDTAHTGGDGGAARNGAGTGNDALSPGGGGGGAKSTATSKTSRRGGNGGLGQIILTYSFPIVNSVKANNTLPLTNVLSWTTGLPSPGGIATWNSTVTGPNTVSLGGDLTFGGIRVTNPAGPVTINAGNTLTLGSQAVDIDMTGATVNLTLNCALGLGGDNVWDVASGRTLTLGGGVSGPYAVNKQGAGKAILSGVNTYAGLSTVDGGTLQLGANDVIPDGGGKGNVSVTGVLDLNTFSETINGLSGAGTVDTVAGGTPTLTVGADNASSTFSGTIQNTAGTLSLFKTGTGTLTLSGVNTYAGATTIDAGILSIGSSSALGGTSNIMITAGATLRSEADGVSVSAPITVVAGAGNAVINAPNDSPGGGIPTTLAINSVISGPDGVTFNSSVNQNALHTVLLNGQNTYTGSTLLDTSGGTSSQIIVRLGTNNALPTTTVVTIDGQTGAGSGRFADLNLNGFNQELAGLRNIAQGLRVQRVVNSDISAAATLTINNTNDYTFSGNLGGTGASVSGTAMPGSSNGNNFGLTKAGTGTFSISGTNTYIGATTVNEGKLLGVVGGSSANSSVVLNNAAATFGVSVADNTLNWTCANLTNNAAGVLEFNFGAVTPSTTVSPLNITGTAAFTATPMVRVVVSTGLSAGTYPLMTWGSATGTAPTTTELTVTTLAVGTVCSLQVSGNTLNLVVGSIAANIVKANNTNNLSLGTSWVGTVAPTLGQVAIWNNTVTSPNTTVLGADVTWAGIQIADPTGLVTINAGNTLTLGVADIDIDLSAATADLTLNCGLALGNANVWDVQSGRTLTVGGSVSGSNPLTTQNAGTVILSSGANSYSGDTTVGAASTLKLGAANAIPNGSGKGNIAVDGALDLNAISTTLNGLDGAGTVDTVAGGSPSLILGAGDGSGTFTGVIQNTAGTLSLVKTGIDRQDLAGANTFSGLVAVSQGWLAVGQSNTPLANASSVTVANGATFGAYDNEVDIYQPIALGAGNPTINIAACVQPLAGGANTVQRPLRLHSGITGTGNVVFKGVNPFNWTGAINVSNCTYTGSTLITTDDVLATINTNNANVVVRLLGTNGLPTTTVVTLAGTPGGGSGRFCDINLGGFPQTLAGLTDIPQDLRRQRVVNAGAAATLTINNSADYTFSGELGASSGGSNPGDNLALTKSGSGTFTIARTSGNTYALGTTINGGTLLVNNNTGSGTGTGDVNVNSGGTLGGTGIISGIVTNNSGGTLAPGASIGTLTLSSNLVLNAGSTNTFEVDGSTPANDQVAVGGSVTYGGVLKIVPSGTFTNGQTFTLFSGAGATDPSNFASITSSGGTYSFANGVLTVVTAPVTAPSPTTLTNSFSGGVLALSWPGGLGWRLEQQTNALSKGLSTNWVNITPGSASSTNITVDKTRPTVFYRLVYP